MLAEALGTLLLLVVLGDVFLTVLYARIGPHLLSHHVARLAWSFVRWASKPLGRYRTVALSLGGPAILVVMVAGWALGLTFGTALIIYPNLGMAVTAKSGETPTDFIAALYAGGGSMAIGSSDFVPHSTGLRLLYLWNSLVGTFVITLTLTYLMQVYTALHRRNALGVAVDLLAAETGDASELVARLGPWGQWNGAHTTITELAVEMTDVEESHHLYPVLFYFRFREVRYSTSRFALMALDAIALIRTALADEPCHWLKESAAVQQLAGVALLLVNSLCDTFVPLHAAEEREPADPRTVERWRRRYFAAVARFRRAGLTTRADEAAGADDYVAQRAVWDTQIARLAPFMAYTLPEVDPVLFKLSAPDNEPEGSMWLGHRTPEPH